MKFWHFGDSHTYHNQLEIPPVEMVIFSGDCSNTRDPLNNQNEIRDFLSWFGELPIKYKVFVAGNHDVSLETQHIVKEDFEDKGIVYLCNEEVEIEGVKIWGSPYTPTFGDWSFMKPRHKIGQIWDQIPYDIDIVITHGPPKGILDLTYDRKGVLENAGCGSLRTKLFNIKPKYHLFGHIHNDEDIINAGYTKLSVFNTIFSNGSIVTDRKFGKISSNGNVFTI